LIKRAEFNPLVYIVVRRLRLGPGLFALFCGRQF
jgi:hypothetical protein